MKTKTLVVIPIFIFVVVAIFFFASCNTTGNGDGNGDGNGAETPFGVLTLAGTWGNPDYNADVGGPPGKFTYTVNDDGTWTAVLYNTVSDTEPVYTMILTVTDEWTDPDGNLFYKAEFEFVSPEYLFELIKIHADNHTMEINMNEFEYPAEIDLDNDYYGIWNR